MSILLDFLLTNIYNIPSLLFLNALNKNDFVLCLFYGLIIDIIIGYQNILIIILFLYFISKLIKSFYLKNILLFLITSFLLYNDVNIISLIIYLIYINIYKEHIFM